MLYEIDDKNKLVIVYYVAHRREAYRWLICIDSWQSIRKNSSLACKEAK